MILIAHRGNIYGKNKNRENDPLYIQEAITAGYDVEVDARLIDNQIWFGHDEPQYNVTEFLNNRSFRKRLWVHAKDPSTLAWMLDYGLHTFSHNVDDAVLTSQNYIWMYPGVKMVRGAIAVMPESVTNKDWDITLAGGICSDEVARWR